MKFCLNSICDKKTLLKADEIRLTAKDNIFDYIEKYPKAKLIVPFPGGASVEELRRYAKLDRIIIAVTDFSFINEIRNIPWFYDAPVRTFFEINNLIRLGSSYVLLDSPLFNNLDKVYEILPATCGIRLIPNVAYWAYIPASSGTCGSWVRPEDLPCLESYNITIEFGDCEGRPRKEEALYRVYNERKWLGDLNNIITNLNFNCDNELIPPELIERRIVCGQRCQSGGSCHLCYRYMKMAQREFMQQLKGK